MSSSPRFLRAAHALYLARLLEDDYAIPQAEFLADHGLSRDALSAPDARVPSRTWGAMLGDASRRSREVGFAVRVGLRAQLPLFGYLGFALMSVDTVRDALRATVELVPGQSDAFTTNLVEGPETSTFYVRDLGDFGGHADLVMVALFVGFVGLMRTLIGRVEPVRAELALPQPADWPWPGIPDHLSFRFDAPAHCLAMATDLLDARILSADPVAKELSLSRCREQLARLAATDSLVVRVRRALAADLSRTADDLAKQLAVSPRALRRHLSEAGVSFRALRDEIREQEAVALLRRPALSLDQIALTLGFGDAAAFSRAFTRWTGKTPGRFRRDLVSSAS